MFKTYTEMRDDMSENCKRIVPTGEMEYYQGLVERFNIEDRQYKIKDPGKEKRDIKDKVKQAYIYNDQIMKSLGWKSGDKLTVSINFVSNPSISFLFKHIFTLPLKELLVIDCRFILDRAVVPLCYLKNKLL